MKIQGKLSKVLNVQNINDTLKKQTFIVTDNDEYNPNKAFELWNDKTDLLKNYKEGDDVVVEFNIVCKESKGNYYTSLRAWKIASTVDEVTNAVQNEDRLAEDELAF